MNKTKGPTLPPELKEIPVLFVEDNKEVHAHILEFLRLHFNNVYGAYDGAEGLASFKKHHPEIVLTDIRMPGMDGLQMASKMKKIIPEVPVIVISAFYEPDLLIKSIDIGIDKFVRKPVDGPGLLEAIYKSALPLIQKKEIHNLNQRIFSSIESQLSRSHTMQEVIKGIQQVAKSDFSVIIQGETGVGKSFIANLIHHLNPRSNKPFITVDIGTIPETLVESELFGHTKGAFTGADRSKKGFFEIAHGGTLFLEELENMTPYVQSKLLRAVEEKRIYPVGSTTPVDVDIRIIGATNRDLFGEVRENKFREDLYYRLCEFDIRVPPLRERPEDIRWLAEKFVKEVAGELEKKIDHIDPDAMEIMVKHTWRGNVREMKNVLRRLVLMSEGHAITAEDMRRTLRLPQGNGDAVFKESTEPLTSFSLALAVEEVERNTINRALAKTGGKKVKAAELLGIDYKTLMTKLSRFKIG